MINLNDINFVLFPDWTQSEEVLERDLQQVVRMSATHLASRYITLLIDTSTIAQDDAELFLSGVTMHLLMAEDFQVTEGAEIVLMGTLSCSEWQDLLPHIQARLVLKCENQSAISHAHAASIPAYDLASLSQENARFFWQELGDGLFQQGKWQAARECYEKILAVGWADAQLYWRLSECLRYLRLTDAAISRLTQGIELYPKEGKLHFSLIMNLHARGRIQEARNRAKIASELFPSNYRFKILKYLLLPIIYDNQAKIVGYRQEFIRGLQALIQETSLETDENQKNALVGIGSLTNFYLPYQAENDRELQSQYGKLVYKIMAANYPQWVVPVSMSPLRANDKIRIGYVSAYLHAYSGTLWLTGWLRYCDRTRFEVYCYYTGNTPDAVTQQFQDYSDVFYHSPGNLEDVCEQILRDQLHILVFPEIGMDPQIRQMGGLRLAPVQCVAWGHPVTTGLPTIDYFLSSELMEPEKAQDHYSERLIRLPNIGVAYPKPYIPPRVKSRSDFQLREDGVIYLCCQAPFKYLPQYDWILAEIARRVPQAQFLFLRGDLLKPRLNRAFAEVGLRSEEYCVFRAIPERLDYLMINLVSDVYLDTFCWSGGNTTLEAIACCLPIVTCPGEFMRGRHSYSFLKMLGVTETIAENQVDYVKIAVKLGVDSAWRREIGERMAQRLDYLYEDRACVAGLEAFYQQIAIP